MILATKLISNVDIKDRTFDDLTVETNLYDEWNIILSLLGEGVEPRNSGDIEDAIFYEINGENK